MRSKENEITLQELYPELNEEELIEAQQNLERYIEVVWKIFQRIELDPAERARWETLTNSPDCLDLE